MPYAHTIDCLKPPLDGERLSRQGEIRRAFFVQYLSVILIVLTVVTGTLLSPPASEQQPEAQMEAGISWGAVSMTEVFEGEAAAISADAIEVIAFPLLQHDIRARISILVEDNFELAYDRLIAVEEALLARGIDADNFRLELAWGREGSPASKHLPPARGLTIRLEPMGEARTT